MRLWLTMRVFGRANLGGIYNNALMPTILLTYLKINLNMNITILTESPHSHLIQIHSS
jgi:hypothetical protein